MAAENNNTNPLAPRDETARIMEQTFGDGDTISVDPDNNADAAAIIGSEMCEKILESSADDGGLARRLLGGGRIHGAPSCLLNATESGDGEIQDRGH
jgi:hypothetical protein